MKLPFWLTISRPRFWIYLVGPFLIGIACYYLQTQRIPWEVWPWLLYMTLPANLFIYGINDLFDYETDVLNAKKQGYEALVPPDKRRMIILSIALTQLPLLPYFKTLDQTSFWLLISFIFLGFFYSAPPLRFKTKPFLDSVSNILYALPGFFIYSFLTKSAPSLNLLFASGLWCMAMHAFSAIPDIEADTRAKLKTIATTLGANGTLFFCLLCYIIAAFLIYYYLPIFAILGGIVYIGYLLFLKFAKNQSWLSAYKYFPKINTIMGMLLFFSILVPSIF